MSSIRRKRQTSTGKELVLVIGAELGMSVEDAPRHFGVTVSNGFSENTVW
jgi:hypothetical protein